jgi:hypothetical protein
VLRWVAHTPADSLFGIAVADTVDSRFTKWALRFAQSHSIQQQALPCGPHLSRSRSERVSQCTCERNSAPRHGCSDAQAPLVLESTRFGPCGAESSAIGVYGYGLPQVITVRPFDELLKYPMAMERALTNPARAAVTAPSNATRCQLLHGAHAQPMQQCAIHPWGYRAQPSNQDCSTQYTLLGCRSGLICRGS